MRRMATWQVKKKGNEGNSNGTLLHLIRNLVDLYKHNGTSTHVHVFRMLIFCK